MSRMDAVVRIQPRGGQVRWLARPVHLVRGYTLFRAADKRGEAREREKIEARPTASFIIAGAH